MANEKLTDTEIKELHLYVDSMERLAAEEPPMYKEPPQDTEIADEWESWNAKQVELTDKHHDTIIKAITIGLDKSSDNPQDVAEIIKSLLPATPGAPANGFYNVPNSPASDLILEILNAANNLQNLPVKKKYIAHSANYEVIAESNNSRKITKKSHTEEITVKLDDIDKFLGSNKRAKKLFVFALIKANEQAVYNGQLLKDYVTFPLQELVDIGFYKSKNSARTGFNKGADTLTSIKVQGHEERPNKGKISASTAEAEETQSDEEKPDNDNITASSIDVLEVLFTGARIIDGQCYIYLNERINWGFFAQYFTILPSYYFKLSNRAGDLLYYIFYLARQHTQEIEKRGYFTIGFRAIQNRLNLPNERGLNNPGRDIKEPIEAAIVEIENENSAYFNNTEFSLLPICDDEAPIADYLNNGYLKVSLKGDFAKTFIDLSKSTAKKIDAANKRQARIADKAKAINTAKATEKTPDPAG